MLQTTESVAVAVKPSTFALLDYHPEFLDSIAESGFQILFDRLNGPEKNFLSLSQLIYSFLYRAGKGDNFSALDIDLLHSALADLTNLIWQLGGNFYNQNGGTVNNEYPGIGNHESA